jgi:hypothetical protein
VRVELSACLISAIVGVGALSCGPAATAEEPSQASAEQLVHAFQQCVAQTDSARRLECYDKAMNRPADNQAPEQRFGLSPAQVIEKEHFVQAPRELTAQVVAVSRPSGGLLRLTLANGQVWATQQPDDSDLLVNVGDSVTLSRGVLGSFLMTTSASGHRSIRVRRLK